MATKIPVIIVDFDKTIYKKDSLLEFCKFIYKRYPVRFFFAFTQLFYFFLWRLNFISTQDYKEKFLIFLYGIDLEKMETLLSSFWKKEQNNLNQELLKRLKEKHATIVCITASPDVFIMPIRHLIPHCKKVIGTKISPNRGYYKIEGINCKGPQKVKMLYSIYAPDRIHILETYSDSMDDLPILRLAQHAFLIKKGKILSFNVT